MVSPSFTYYIIILYNNYYIIIIIIILHNVGIWLYFKIESSKTEKKNHFFGKITNKKIRRWNRAHSLFPMYQKIKSKTPWFDYKRSNSEIWLQFAKDDVDSYMSHLKFKKSLQMFFFINKIWCGQYTLSLKQYSSFY